MNRSRLTHGTLEGYRDHRCRCRKCKEVWELYQAEFRENIFDETKAKYQEVNIHLSDEDYSERRGRR